MKNYKVTNRGKILLILYFMGIIGSYFFSPLVFYSLSGILVMVIGIEIINDLIGVTKKDKVKSKDKKEEKTDEIEAKIALEDFETDAKTQADDQEKRVLKEALEDVGEKKTSGKSLEMAQEDYGSLVDNFESIEEDIQSMEKDLEVIGKKATDLQKVSIENYYQQKKKTLDNATATNNTKAIDEVPKNFEEVSLLDRIMEHLKEIFSFKKYKNGSLVLHNHFGIGKIVDVEDSLKVSFINDQLEEIIEFEYDKNNKIPELNLFRAPKGEDERQYYYNYKRDVSDELFSTMEKIELNLPDIKYQWNIFLKSGDAYEKYDFIAISDQVHIFSKETKNQVKTQLLEELLENFELEFKIHEISEYPSINSILLKSKIKGIMPLEIMHAVNEEIAENNIKDFNERMQYSNKLENL